MKQRGMTLAIAGLVLGAAVALLQVSDWALPVLVGVLLLVASSIALVYGLVISTGGMAMAAGPWEERVRFSRDGSSAFVPRAVAVKADAVEAGRAREALVGEGLDVGDPVQIITGWYRLDGDFDPPTAVEILRTQGFTAQVIHVFFSHSMEGSPFYGSPFYGSPFYGSPFYGSPFYGSPFYGSPFYGSPFYGSATPSPFALPLLRDTGRRPSSALPETPRGRIDPRDPGGRGMRGIGEDGGQRRAVRVAILDTGWINGAQARLRGMNAPIRTAVPGATNPLPLRDRPDGDEDGRLDPITGHATFIAGIIEQLTPGCELRIMPVLTEYGDGREDDIARALEELALLGQPEHARGAPPDVVNLSFGGYTSPPPGQEGIGGMELLQDAVTRLQAMGTVIVASAGNDGAWVPTYPAAFRDVVGVGALDARGYPASFSNHGDWVRACAVGVDVVSIFFNNFRIEEAEFFDLHPRRFKGWAKWNGSSFAAPCVVAALAEEVARNGFDTAAAVASVIGPGDGLDRLPMLGTVVNP